MSYVRSSIHCSLSTDVSEDYPKQARFARAGHKNTHTRKSVIEAKSHLYSHLAMYFESSLKGRKKVFSKQVNKNTLKSQRALALCMKCEFLFTIESRDKNILKLWWKKRRGKKKSFSVEL